MDGLDRLIEMLEKRFGKRWADGLLLIAVLGGAAWGINSLFVYLIVPATRVIMAAVAYLEGGPVTLTREQVILLVVQAVSFVLTVTLGSLWFRWWVRWQSSTVRRQAHELDELLARGQKYAEELRAGIDLELEGARETSLEVDSIVRDARAFSRKTFAELRAANEKMKVESDLIIERAKIGANQILVDARAEVKSLAPSPQSPPDTEPKKRP